MHLLHGIALCYSAHVKDYGVFYQKHVEPAKRAREHVYVTPC